MANSAKVMLIITELAPKANKYIKDRDLTSMRCFNVRQSYRSPIIELIKELVLNMDKQNYVSKNDVYSLKNLKRFAKEYTTLQMFEFIWRLLPLFEYDNDVEIFFDSLDELFK